MDEIKLTHTYLDQLRAQQDALEKFLQFHREDTTAPKSIGVQLTIEIYVHILEDALQTINSVIQYYEGRKDN